MTAPRRDSPPDQVRGRLWNDTRDAELRRLWDAGEPTRAIVVALGLSKSSVLGRADRGNVQAGGVVRRIQALQSLACDSRHTTGVGSPAGAMSLIYGAEEH